MNIDSDLYAFKPTAFLNKYSYITFFILILISPDIIQLMVCMTHNVGLKYRHKNFILIKVDM